MKWKHGSIFVLKLKKENQNGRCSLKPDRHVFSLAKWHNDERIERQSSQISYPSITGIML